MAAVTANGASRNVRKPAKAPRVIRASKPAEARMPSFLREDGSRYAFTAMKCVAAAVFFFGALCALIYTAAEPRRAAQKVSERHKSTAPTRLGSALVSKIDVLVRDAPRRDASILNKAVYGSYVEVIAQDGRWVQVRATGQNVTGWVEKSGLNF